MRWLPGSLGVGGTLERSGDCGKVQSVCPERVKEGGGRPLEGCGPIFQKQRERKRFPT